MDKSKMTKTSTKDLIKVLRSGRHRDPRAEREIAELKATIAMLQSKPLIVPEGPAINQTLLDSVEERHKLSKQVQDEQHKYSKMVQEVRIYKGEAEEQAKRLSVQLQAAYAELEQIQTSLKDVVRLSGLALTSSTTAFAKVDAVRDHKCKYATTILETYEESSSYTMHRASASFSQSGSDHLSSP
jgi:chorismate mutase